MIDYQTLRNWSFPPVRHSYTKEDCMRYALALGIGSDPMASEQLQFVSEVGPLPLQVMPSMAVVLGFPGSWLADPRTGVNFAHIVHGEEGIELHRTFRTQGTVVAHHRVTRVVDKGPGRGALITYEKDLFDADDGSKLATVRHTTFARADGGFSRGPLDCDAADPPPQAVPEGAPDRTWEFTTMPQQALLYRLCADRNPLHASPEAAIGAGFQRPILHGLCSFGIACRAILATWCASEPARLATLSGRFSAPVTPGETLRFEMFAQNGSVSFRARTVENGRMVLDYGHASFRQVEH